MKLKIIIPISVLAAIIIALGITVLVFFSQSPVLIITDELFTTLYGEERADWQQFYAALSLFRPVKTVLVADGVGPDILVITLGETEENPYCVIFPRGYLTAAERYHMEFPEIPVIFLNGNTPISSLPISDDNFFIYNTDMESDMYRAGLIAGILTGLNINPGSEKTDKEKTDKEKTDIEKTDINENSDAAGEITKKKIVVLGYNRSVQSSMRNIFSRGLQEKNPESTVVFANSSTQIPTIDISCMVFAGACYDYLEKNPKIPLILFTWLDPVYTSNEAAVIFDDSPWALLVPAVRLAEKKETEKNISSNILTFSEKIADNEVIRKIKEAENAVFDEMFFQELLTN